MKIVLLSLFVGFVSIAYSQEKQIFSEQFMDNHHSWPTAGKSGVKVRYDKNRGFDIENKSQQTFATLVPVIIDTTKNYHIILRFVDLSSYDNNFKLGKIYLMFGAIDENNGYLVEQGDKFLNVFKVENGQRTELYKGNPSNAEDGFVNIRCINDRWKFYKNAIEIADMPAQPLLGKMMGVMVDAGSHAGLKSLTVTQWVREQ